MLTKVRPVEMRGTIFFRLLLVTVLTLLFLSCPVQAAVRYNGTWQSGSGGGKVKAIHYRSGKYRLIDLKSGKTLTVSSVKKGARLKKTAWKKKAAQLWTVKKNKNGTITFLSVKNKRYALSITKEKATLEKKSGAKSMSFAKETSAPRKAGAGGISSAANGVSQNGWLSVRGTQLVNEHGSPLVLHGMSSHGLQWYSNFTTSNAIGATAAYGANLFRVAMYTEENGYLSNKSGILEKLYDAVDAALSRNMYVIIDWHILSDFNPKTHQSEAKTFFNRVSAHYANTPGVLYEICNEPNGGTGWKEIKSYANAVIPVIRKNSPRSVIIVGTPTWSQDVDVAAADPLSYANVMYAFHFYAGTHGQWLRDKVSMALSKGAPVFVSEWGTSAADGNGGVYKSAANIWISFMKQHSLSWANWSLCDKSESSAALKPGANAENGIGEKELSASGKYVFSQF